MYRVGPLTALGTLCLLLGVFQALRYAGADARPQSIVDLVGSVTSALGAAWAFTNAYLLRRRLRLGSHAVSGRPTVQPRWLTPVVTVLGALTGAAVILVEGTYLGWRLDVVIAFAVALALFCGGLTFFIFRLAARRRSLPANSA